MIAAMATRLPLLLVLALLIAFAAAQEDFDVVETAQGAVRGSLSSRAPVRVFEGIPYGRAPVGDLRFASPQPAPSWAPEVRDALAPGAICPGGRIQAVFGLFQRTDVSEDCLYLNVYTPTRERITRPLPVLFWIHGGAFLLGDGTGGGLYSGVPTAGAHDVIVVSHNYRLGAFGFLVTPDGANGNFAMEDQRLALQWVRDNIAAFGGDASNVTLFGESAGGTSVAAHMVSPPSQGLFHRAILQSNPFAVSTKTRAQMLETGARVAENLNCTYDLACLRSKTMRDIATNSNVGSAGKEAVVADMMTWAPTIDGVNMNVAPLAAFRDGQGPDMPVIIGTNSGEAVLFQDIVDIVLRVVSLLTGRDLAVDMQEPQYRFLVEFIFQDSGAGVLAYYPPLPNNASNYDQFVQIITTYMFQCSSRQVR